MKAKITFIGDAVAEVEGTPEEVAHVLRAVPAASCTCGTGVVTGCPVHVVHVRWTGRLAWHPGYEGAFVPSVRRGTLYPAAGCAAQAGPSWWVQDFQ